MITVATITGPFVPASAYLPEGYSDTITATDGSQVIEIQKGSGNNLSDYVYMDFEYSRNEGVQRRAFEGVSIFPVIPHYGCLPCKIPPAGWGVQMPTTEFLRERVRLNKTEYATRTLVATVQIYAECKQKSWPRGFTIKNIKFGSPTAGYKYITVQASGAAIVSPPAGNYPINLGEVFEVKVRSPAGSAIRNFSVDGHPASYPWLHQTMLCPASGEMSYSGDHADGEWQTLQITCSSGNNTMTAKIETGRIA